MCPTLIEIYLIMKYKARIAMTYNSKVGGYAVISLKKGFIESGCEVGTVDYRALMNEVPAKEFEICYRTKEGRKKLLAHAKAVAVDILSKYDCLVIPGSASMIDPSLFGAEQNLPDNQYDFSRTLAELALVHVALQKGMPIWGVCGGHQVIAVYGGGTVRGLTSSEKSHHHYINYDKIRLKAESMLKKIMQPEDPTLEISSFGAHFQAVAKLGKDSGLMEAAMDINGEVLEAAEAKHGAPLITTQFHPEIMAQGYYKPQVQVVGLDYHEIPIADPSPDNPIWIGSQKGMLWAGGNPNRCGLIKMKKDPTASAFNLIEQNFAGKDAIILFDDKLYYADLKNRKVTAIIVNAQHPEDYSKLKKLFTDNKRFKNDYSFVQDSEIQLIINTTGKTPPKREESERLRIIKMGKSLFDFFKNAATTFHNKKILINEFKLKKSPIETQLVSPNAPQLTIIIATSKYNKLPKSMLTGIIVTALLFAFLPHTSVTIASLSCLSLITATIYSFIDNKIPSPLALIINYHKNHSKKTELESTPANLLIQYPAKLWNSSYETILRMNEEEPINTPNIEQKVVRLENAVQITTTGTTLEPTISAQESPSPNS